jgi:PBP1b-binding outer membrane lipoprotein LpoB
VIGQYLKSRKGFQSMKKILITCVGLLLMFSYGCSSEDPKTSTEKAKEAVIEARDKAVEVGNDTVKATKKKVEIEGC